MYDSSGDHYSAPRSIGYDAVSQDGVNTPTQAPKRRKRGLRVRRARAGPGSISSDTSSAGSVGSDASAVTRGLTATCETRDELLARKLLQLAALLTTGMEAGELRIEVLGLLSAREVSSQEERPDAEDEQQTIHVMPSETSAENKLGGKPKFQQNIQSRVTLARVVDRVAVPMAEVDMGLLYTLKREALFVERNPELQAVLKRKACKYMDGFDTSAIGERGVFNMILRAVGNAMVLDQEEVDIRHLYRAGARGMHAHADVVRGNIGPKDFIECVGDFILDRPSTLPLPA